MFPTIRSQQDQIVQVRLTFPKMKPATQTWSRSIGPLWISTPTSRSQRCGRTRTKCGVTTKALACMSTALQPLQRSALDVEATTSMHERTIAKTFGFTSWRLAIGYAAMTPPTASTGTTTTWIDIVRTVQFWHLAIQSTGSIGIGIALVLNSPIRSTACQTTRLPPDIWRSCQLQIHSRSLIAWPAPQWGISAATDLACRMGQTQTRSCNVLEVWWSTGLQLHIANVSRQIFHYSIWCFCSKEMWTQRSRPRHFHWSNYCLGH